MTEQEVLDIISRAVNKVSYSFRFAYFDPEDVKQEATIIAIEGLESYDPNYKLYNFLLTHLRNRLLNLKRKIFQRYDAPCKGCAANATHPPTEACVAFDRWVRNNKRKMAVVVPGAICSKAAEEDSATRLDSLALKEAEQNELIARLDEVVPASLRAYWLRLKVGKKVPKAKKMLLFDIIRGALKGEAHE